MIVLDKNTYRICTKVHIDKNGNFINDPICSGLSIEKIDFYTDSNDNPVYYVVCFVEYDKHENEAKIEGVGTRLLDIEDNEWPLVRELIRTAKQLVETANKEFDI